jgi:FkbM family methyltransferase
MEERIKLWVRKIFGQSFVFKLKSLYSRFCNYKNYYFSQFGEDVVLRVLVGSEQKKGFYVDVGAYHPKHLSNTYFFYKKGWHGINIDANPRAVRLFDALRPKDTNVNAVISNSTEEHVFYSWDSVYDTISKTEAEKVRSKLGPEKFIGSVKTKTLASVLDSFLPANQSIDILNVDAEGHDLEVLQSNNWQKYKPRFLVVEYHETDIEKIMSSEKVKYLESLGYKLCSWVCSSLIFRL